MGEIEADGTGVHLETAGLEVVAAVELNLSGFVIQGCGSELDHLVGHRTLHTDARHLFAVDAAFIKLYPAGTAECAQGACGVKLRVKQAGQGQVPASERENIGKADFAGAHMHAELRVRVNHRRRRSPGSESHRDRKSTRL